MNDIKFPCNAARLQGQKTRLLAVEIVREYRERKRCCIAGRDRITPPLQSSEERGQGSSTNAAMHRLIGKFRDMT